MHIEGSHGLCSYGRSEAFVDWGDSASAMGVLTQNYEVTFHTKGKKKLKKRTWCKLQSKPVTLLT